jgi:hypothetical protein
MQRGKESAWYHVQALSAVGVGGEHLDIVAHQAKLVYAGKSLV